MRNTMTAVAAGTATVALSALLTGTGAATAAPDPWGLRHHGEFARPTAGAGVTAVTYDEELIPAGAGITVTQLLADGGMTVELAVAGVRPGHTFGAHVHTGPCGTDPDAAGGHYQDRPGDAARLANPRNEVWLDFTADAAGSGWATAHQEWVFRAGGAASVVLHEHATSTGGHHGGTPGDAGERVGCFTVPFAGAGPDGQVTYSGASEGE